MKTKTFVRLLALFWSLLTLSPQLSAAPLGTAFTYQGRLNDNDAPANGSYDLKFTLCDSAGGPTVINAPLTNTTTPVSNGLFTVVLDFGPGAFSGDARWLEIAVRTNASASDFVILAPRQALTATPFARYATSAGNAASAGTATTADSATTVVPNGVNNASLQTGAVTSDKIASGAVRSAQLASNAVTTASLANGAVGAAQLAAGAVTSASIAAGAVTAAKLEAGIGVWTKAGNDISYNAGKVGIATASPQAALHVASADGDNSIISETLAADRAAAMKMLAPGAHAVLLAGGENYMWWGGPLSLNLVNVANGPITFAHSIGGAAFERVRITSAGNVGIGDATPTDALVIGQGGNLVLKASGDNAGDIIFQTSNGTQKGRIFSEPAAGQNKLHLTSGDNNADITIDPSGNVGIGTGTPASLLHINGDLQASRLKVGSGHTLGGALATIAGGSGNSVSRDYAVVGGGSQNTNAGLASGILAGNNNNIKANANYSVIGGGILNYVSGSYATVGGGFSCGAADYGFVGGGEANSASQVHAVVSGGKNNMARGVLAVVGGGEYNYATNSYATIPGGYNNQANGSYSFAAGCLARANHTGAFVWADSQNAFFNSTASNQVSFRCQGGVRFTSASGAANQTVSWTPGSGSWSFSSDRALKEGFVPVDSQTVLDKVSRLPVSEWNYAGYSQRHIGPMAQDFHTAFPLSGSDTMLNDADLHGVALAAIQGLNQKTEVRSQRAEERIHKLEAENAALQTRLERLEHLLETKLNGGAR